MSTDIVRVLRVIEYIGPREAVEQMISFSIQGEKYIERTGITIKTATIGNYPEILNKEEKTQ